MEKSRSRSPRWRPRPPPHRSPERNRHRYFQDYHHNNDGFHRDSRRPTHWEDEQYRQNNSRNTPYNHYNDNKYEHDSFASDSVRSSFEASNRLKRVYSPEQRDESNRRLPPKCPKDVGYRDHNRNFHNDRNNERNAYNGENAHDAFKAVRREDNFHRPYNRDHGREWRDNDGHWNQHDHPNQYSSPPRRRPEEFVERKSFQKRYPEDDYREHEQPYKRAREAERPDFRPPLRSSHWKNNHPERPYSTDLSNDRNHRDPNPTVHKKHSGNLSKIEIDYKHRSPVYLHSKPVLSDDRVERHDWNEERKTAPNWTLQHHKTSDRDSREWRYETRSSETLSKSSSRKNGDDNSFKSNVDNKYPNHKHMERERKVDEYRKRTEDEYEKDPASLSHLSNQSLHSQDPKAVLKNTPEKESSLAKLALKKSVDKYRQPHQHKNVLKALPPKFEAAGLQRTSEVKQTLVDDMQKRSKSASKERQMSRDLVAVAGKEKFHPVFEHLDISVMGGAVAQNTEFTKKIITIIHEVKANNFRSTGISLHERFSKLKEESNKQELKLNNPALQTNPEIHRRIDISLEELQKKSLNKTVDVLPDRHRVLEDPHDLRHDIERRRKQRLHSEQNGTTDDDFADSDVSGSCYGLKAQETGEYHTSSRMSRTPYQNSSRRSPTSYYKGKSSQYYTSPSRLEDSEEFRKPYKGWRNPAARI